MKNNYLKILAGALFVLIIFEWIHGIQVSVRLNKAATLQIPKISNTMLAHKPSKAPRALHVHLFGEMIPDALALDSVKASALNLSVVGILFASDEATSHVMLALPDKTVQLFRVGDEVPGGAVIKRITPKGILLMHHGMLESLNLPQNELLFSPPAAILKQD